MDALEREERLLQEQLDDGKIDTREYNRQLKEIQGEYAYHAHEAAQRAYYAEIERW